MRRRTTLLSIAAAGTVLLLVGCGTTEEVNPTPSPDAAGTTITDDRGEVIELDAPAEKVVALQWNAVESLVALGVMPVGVADVEGYGTWVTAEPLDDTVKDVGQRGEPSIDSIAGLAPDLVIAMTDLPATAVTQIEQIAPVLVLRPADASNAIGQMEKNLTSIATATGTEAEAEGLLAGFDDKIAEGKAALEAAGLGGAEFAMTDSWVAAGQVAIRPFAEGSLLSAVTEELGLVNAWPGEGDENYGLDSTDVEGLTALGDVHFFYIASEDDAYQEELADNAVWKSLPFVASGNVHRLPDGIWMFGGPSSMNAYIDAVTATLTA